MTETKLNISLENFLNDSALSALKELRRKENVFSILKLHNAEIRHSNFLAWLLNPEESHELGTLFLQEFLFSCFQNISCFSNLKGVKVKREWNNIDLLIEGDTWVLIIENKNRSFERKDQLKKYFDIAESFYRQKQPHYIFLTLNNTEPSHKSYHRFCYKQIVSILSRILITEDIGLKQRSRIYIEDYLQTLNELGMGEDPVRKLSQKIYYTHRELFDFIYSRRSDSLTLFAEGLKGFLKKRNCIIGSHQQAFVRFYPKVLDEYIPVGKGEGWINKESFLFEYFLHSDTELILRATINGNDENTKKLFLSIFQKDQDFMTHRINDIWTWAFEWKATYDRHKILIIDDAEEEDAYFTDIFNSFESGINRITNLILANTSINKNLRELTYNRKPTNEQPH